MRSINWFIIRLAAPLRRLRSDDRGVVAIVVGLAVPVLLGFAALAVDTSMWSSAKNSAQGAADAAVLSVVAAATAGSNATQIQNEAYASAALSGFTNGQNGVTLTINNPPKSGPNTSNTGAYEVIIAQPQTRHFAGVLGAAPTISGRAVAIVAGTPACILALDRSATKAADVGLSGGADIGAPNCAVAANSSDSSAVSLSGGSTLKAANLNVVGNYSVTGGATVTATIKTNAPVTRDPYGCSGGKCLAVPSFSTSGCLPDPSLSGGATGTITPGCYDGISVSGGATLTMRPGNYVINGGGGMNLSGGSKVTMGAGIYTFNGGSFSPSGGNTIDASGGVSIILTNTPSASTTPNWGNVNLSGGANLTLTAPSSGPMQGVAVYMDRNAPASISDSFTGGTSMAITGSLYLPSQPVSYSGGSSTASKCLQLIALTVSFSGGSSFGVNCGTLNVPGLQPQQSGTQGVPAE
ncbi:MAG: TadE/TadG family type IV pilus assembly protein [Methylocella sp.]